SRSGGLDRARQAPLTRLTCSEVRRLSPSRGYFATRRTTPLRRRASAPASNAAELDQPGTPHRAPPRSRAIPAPRRRGRPGPHRRTPGRDRVTAGRSPGEDCRLANRLQRPVYGLQVKCLGIEAAAGPGQHVLVVIVAGVSNRREERLVAAPPAAVLRRACALPGEADRGPQLARRINRRHQHL